MKENRFFIFILVILFAFGLAACTKSASQPSTSDEDTNLPLPTMGTQEPMNMLEEMATQTAMALEGGAQEAAAETSGDDTVAKEAGDAGGETAAEAETSTEGGEQAAEGETSGGTDEEAGGGQEIVIDPDDYDVPDSYTLKSGEFPYCIARRFNISPVDLLSANGLSLNSQVYPGTKLTIPKNAGTFDQGSRALKSHPTN
ncbi:MAG: LysM peptidoglycan-binding domain-containing protein, partial [Anaerolineales bacterium]|nr:LysM peptidoglycan-binding domain-containing protein [Anaerolineales bacterium]